MHSCTKSWMSKSPPRCRARARTSCERGPQTSDRSRAPPPGGRPFYDTGVARAGAPADAVLAPGRCRPGPQRGGSAAWVRPWLLRRWRPSKGARSARLTVSSPHTCAGCRGAARFPRTLGTRATSVPDGASDALEAILVRTGSETRVASNRAGLMDVTPYCARRFGGHVPGRHRPSGPRAPPKRRCGTQTCATKSGPRSRPRPRCRNGEARCANPWIRHGGRATP